MNRTNWEMVGAVVTIIGVIITVILGWDQLHARVFGPLILWLVQRWRYLVRIFKQFGRWLQRYLVIAIPLILIEILLYLAYADWKMIVFSITHFVLIAFTTRLMLRS